MRGEYALEVRTFKSDDGWSYEIKGSLEQRAMKSVHMTGGPFRTRRMAHHKMLHRLAEATDMDGMQ